MFFCYLKQRYALLFYICNMKRILVIMLFPFSVFGQAMNGRAVGVSDGDTFTLLTSDTQQFKIRLHGIDCPEKGQDYGRVATEFTRDFLDGKDVRVVSTTKDRYGRSVGLVIVNKDTLNTALLKAGLAWHYKTYDKRKDWADMEQSAKSNGIGLWADKNPIAPWDWRKKKHAK